ncbi:hypothetical protein RND71_010033 [Anisodus tanguticus]|uniref:Uncharacterized protein n=1 Tax=Anisodus tanguticus TaxID=243964 RepID=A0AAE1SGH2_9SOLA|nr:hypothetical protein RND71_010033 [Anisodus tanguticus]
MAALSCLHVTWERREESGEWREWDVQQRLCTSAEINFYSASLLEVADESGTARSSNYLRPNKNCNLSSWISGCEPGWACSAGNGTKVDFENDKEMPSRTLDCQSCCEGFFCPHGLTCMIPCPMGAYCPLSKLNTTTGICDPYRYQLPPGETNHTCGGADMWADFMSATEIFCSAGFYCPSTVEKAADGIIYSVAFGASFAHVRKIMLTPFTHLQLIYIFFRHYCRAGSTEQTSLKRKEETEKWLRGRWKRDIVSSLSGSSLPLEEGKGEGKIKIIHLSFSLPFLFLSRREGEKFN